MEDTTSTWFPNQIERRGLNRMNAYAFLFCMADERRRRSPIAASPTPSSDSVAGSAQLRSNNRSHCWK
jgi:hypothetical protein